MSEPFRPYEKLVEITVLGKKFQVPERNSLLRCFQFISPETIPYGRFCWNQDCQYCRVSCQLPDDDEPREMLSCKFIVMPGMEITELSQELKWCLRSKLPSGQSGLLLDLQFLIRKKTRLERNFHFPAVFTRRYTY